MNNFPWLLVSLIILAFALQFGPRFRNSIKLYFLKRELKKLVRMFREGIDGFCEENDKDPELREEEKATNKRMEKLIDELEEQINKL
jgi:hypothetical protein